MRLYLVDVTDRGLSEMFICESNLRIREFCLAYFRRISNGMSPYIEWSGLGMAQAYIGGGLDVFVHQINYDNSKAYHDAWDRFQCPEYLAYKERKEAKND